MSSHIPVISWKSSNNEIVDNLKKADGGICIIKDVDVSAPFEVIQGLYDDLYKNPKLVRRINEVYPKRGIFKDSAFKAAVDNKDVDKKVPFDLSPARLMAIINNDAALIEEMGANFKEVISFFVRVQDEIIARMMGIASSVITDGPNRVPLKNLHRDMNFNYRLLDYYHQEGQELSSVRRCGEHRDYGTFTLIFQDSVGGLEVKLNDKSDWIPVPPNEVVFLWGWSAVLLSSGRVEAPLHRVTGNAALRKNSAVFFVAPDLDVELTPRKAGGVSLTTEELKAMMGRRWRHREGTLVPEDLEESKEDKNDWLTDCKSQDEAVKKILLGA